MEKTYVINPGHQYDRDGVRIDLLGRDGHALLSAGYSWEDGDLRCSHGDLVINEPAVNAALGRVYRTRLREIVTVGAADSQPHIPGTAELEIAACQLWDPEDGCPRHGELCNPDYR